MRHFRTFFCLVVITLCGSVGAFADSRVRQTLYDPTEIVALHGHSGFQTMVVFAQDEKIENVAVGDSAGWQVTPNRRGNALFVKPLQPSRITNMTVVTDKRSYMFELLGRAGRTKPLYQLQFTYPPELEPEPVIEEVVEDAPIAETKPDAAPTTLNFDWHMKGKKRLLPSRVFDDGATTFLWWPQSASTPAIFAVQPDGSESPVNQSYRDGYVVIDHVPDQLMLRLGKYDAQVFYSGQRRVPEDTDLLPAEFGLLAQVGKETGHAQ